MALVRTTLTPLSIETYHNHRHNQGQGRTLDLANENYKHTISKHWGITQSEFHVILNNFANGKPDFQQVARDVTLCGDANTYYDFFESRSSRTALLLAYMKVPNTEKYNLVITYARLTRDIDWGKTGVASVASVATAAGTGAGVAWWGGPVGWVIGAGVGVATVLISGTALKANSDCTMTEAMNDVVKGYLVQILVDNNIIYQNGNGYYLVQC